MMNIDLHMREEFWARRQKTSQKEAKGYQEEDDAAFHFIAFVPIEGEVWKLDGLDRQPQNLGIGCPSVGGIRAKANAKNRQHRK